MDVAWLARLAAQLGEVLWAQVGLVQAVARDVPVFLVGGLVRDVLLGRESVDVDVVLGGDALGVGRTAVARGGGELVVHARFGTAVWFLPGDGGTIDLITARRERYSEPGALPSVTPAGIEADLARRDFSINALAVRLGDGHLLDLHGGTADLEAGLVRVLHEQSFVDDATRLWRAVRYEQRLGFAIEPETLGWMARDVGFLATISRDRIRGELMLVLGESRRVAMLRRLAELGVLADVHPALGVGEGMALLPATADPLVALLVWLGEQSVAAQTAVVVGLHFPREVQAGMVALRGLLGEASAWCWDERTKPSAITAVLDRYAGFEGRVLAAAGVLLPRYAPFLQRYWAEWRMMAAGIDGYTLRELGVAPGPIYKEVLTAVRAAVLDGEVVSVAEERALAVRLLAKADEGAT